MDQRLYALPILLAGILQIDCLDFQSRSCSISGQESNTSVFVQYNVSFCRNASEVVCTSEYSHTLNYTFVDSSNETDYSILQWERNLDELCEGEDTNMEITNCQSLWGIIGFNATSDAINITALDTCNFRVLVINVYPSPLLDSDDPPRPPKTSRPKNNKRNQNSSNNDNSRHFLFYFQFIVIPIAIVLLIFIVYYLYKIEYANKNVKFYCVSEQFESAYEINQLI
ncbi:uncharacterized protein LOC117117261 [Anneissia japonica]|uniref:uncharacterized protein LOC117117261 n=1 Tax=Anneissia japonica TaxID=1529436 RepID=UPI00142562FA|nr:uncharacterized protein LOC117117261 [Anneissia japonica]